MPVGFFDNAVSAGDFAAEWTSSRFTITPTQGPAANQPMKLAGVWELSGMGFAREGVNLVFDASGSGRAVKITKGREVPNEISLKLDPATFENVINVYICPPGQSHKFNFTFQQVDPAGVATFTRSWTGCVTTGDDSNTPNDGTPHDDTFKFKPTRRN